MQAYLAAQGDTYAGRFNASGRAYPDVSAHGVNYAVVTAGKNLLSSGTSASAPTFASVIALLNDRLTGQGRPPLGFLNPFIYSSPVEVLFNNITEGSNPGCGTPGFTAQAGWNPVTGLGSPDYEKLAHVIGV